ncbi:hypothetical protein TNCV_2839121 [Trichonephila clavipes]|nr:hypothetical protein TNCV_2839121 [Trichonephila clavipes]
MKIGVTGAVISGSEFASRLEVFSGRRDTKYHIYVTTTFKLRLLFTISDSEVALLVLLERGNTFSFFCPGTSPKKDAYSLSHRMYFLPLIIRLIYVMTVIGGVFIIAPLSSNMRDIGDRSQRLEPGSSDSSDSPSTNSHSNGKFLRLNRFNKHQARTDSGTRGRSHNFLAMSL